MQSMGYLLLLVMLLGIAIINSSDAMFLNRSTLMAWVDDPNLDPAFTTPDYSNPIPLHMFNGNGPMFRSGWDNNCPERDRAQKAFLEVGVLAIASTNYMKNYLDGLNDGSILTRYFPPSRAGIVLNMLAATCFNVKLVNDVLVPITDPGSPTWNAKMKYIDMRYDAFPVGTEGGKFDLYCRNPLKPANDGITFNGDAFGKGYPPERVLIMLCPYAFAWPDLPARTDDSKCDILRASPYLTCNQLTLSAILFHELLHDQNLHGVDTVPSMRGIPVGDFDKKDDPSNPSNYPDGGYGPWNAMILRKASANDPRVYGPTLPLFNADSYAMFAVETFWSEHCGVVLIDPPSKAATFVGYIPPQPLRPPPPPPPPA